MKKVNWLIVVTGLVVGAAAVVLTKFGNPANMGFCIACFLRDIAGSLKLHEAAVVQYFRPEIVGIIVGALIVSFATGEFRAKVGSSTFVRLVLGIIVMIGALIFLGCPLRMVIRMGGGDLNAFVGFVGFIVGILIGIVFLKKGYSLYKTHDTATVGGVAVPGIFVILFILFLAVPTIFVFSTKGPGSMHAPIIMSFIIALVVGALAQKSRLCMVGGLRDIVMFKDFNLFSGFIAVFVAVLVGNIVLGKFNGFSTLAQPISHSSQVWNFLGMVIVGWGSCLLGGCPLRQLILTGEGNIDSGVTVIGMIIGAAISHRLLLAGSADTVATAEAAYKVGGISQNGKIAAVICLVILLIVSYLFTFKKQVKVKK